MQKKHTVALQSLREHWGTDIDYNHRCWVSSGSKKIHKFRTRNAYREGNNCQGTVTRAQICNEQPEYSEVHYAWSVTWRRMLWWNKTVIHTRNAKIEMILIISLKNNMHPLWYEIEDDGSFRMDSNGKKIPWFDRPHKLLRLSMAEKLLIQRCANFVPSVHLQVDVTDISYLF